MQLQTLRKAKRISWGPSQALVAICRIHGISGIDGDAKNDNTAINGDTKREINTLNGHVGMAPLVDFHQSRKGSTFASGAEAPGNMKLRLCD